MNDAEFEYKINQSLKADIYRHLSLCETDFVENLKLRIGLEEYSSKLFEKARRFEFWHLHELAALVAVYFNLEEKKVFVTNVSVLGRYQGRGLASKLITTMKEFAEHEGYDSISLEVIKTNAKAIHLYKKIGFMEYTLNHNLLVMKLKIK